MDFNGAYSLRTSYFTVYRVVWYIIEPPTDLHLIPYRSKHFPYHLQSSQSLPQVPLSYLGNARTSLSYTINNVLRSPHDFVSERNLAGYPALLPTRVKNLPPAVSPRSYNSPLLQPTLADVASKNYVTPYLRGVVRLPSTILTTYPPVTRASSSSGKSDKILRQLEPKNVAVPPICLYAQARNYSCRSLPCLRPYVSKQPVYFSTSCGFCVQPQSSFLNFIRFVTAPANPATNRGIE